MSRKTRLGAALTGILVVLGRVTRHLHGRAASAANGAHNVFTTGATFIWNGILGSNGHACANQQDNHVDPIGNREQAPNVGNYDGRLWKWFHDERCHIVSGGSPFGGGGRDNAIVRDGQYSIHRPVDSSENHNDSVRPSHTADGGGPPEPAETHAHHDLGKSEGLAPVCEAQMRVAASVSAAVAQRVSPGTNRNTECVGIRRRVAWDSEGLSLFDTTRRL